MIALLLLAACGPRWTEAKVVAPTLTRMDSDKNGAVEKGEYDAVLYRGVPFEKADGDGDGVLSASELLALVNATDPVEAISPGATARAARSGRDAANPKSTPGPGARPSGGPPGGHGGPAEKPESQPIDAPAIRSEAQLVVKMILESLREEIRAKSPNYPTPTDDDLKRVAGTADIRTAESRAMLLDLEHASDAVGVAFPTSLREAALRERPVVPSFIPGSLGEIPGPGGGPAGQRPEGGMPGEVGRPGGPPGGPPPTDPRTPAGTP
jgi:hypothetical protein